MPSPPVRPAQEAKPLPSSGKQELSSIVTRYLLIFQVQGPRSRGRKWQSWGSNSRTHTPNHHKQGSRFTSGSRVSSLQFTQLESCQPGPYFTLTQSWKGTVPSVSSSLPGLRVQRPLLLAIHLPARDFQIRPPCGPGSRYPVVSLTLPDSISRRPKPNSPSFPNLLLPQSSPTQKRATSLAAQAKTPGDTLNTPLSHSPHGSSWGSFFERDPSSTFHPSPPLPG